MLTIVRTIFGLTMLAALGLFLTGLLLQDDRLFLVAAAHLSLGALLFIPAFMEREISPFDPLSLFILYVMLGTVGTSYVMGFTESRRALALLNDEPISLFIWGALCLVGAHFCIGLGYGACKSRLRVERAFPRENLFDSSGLHLSALIGLGIAFLATVVYIQQTGGISGLANLSKKRALEVSTGVNGQVVYANGGYIRLAASLPMLYLYLVLAYYLKWGLRITLQRGVFLFALLLMGVALPFLGSSRSTIAYSLIGILFVFWVFRGLSRQAVIITVLIGMMTFSFMTALRVYANTASSGALEVPNPIVALAESGNGMSLSGTSLILDGVPERMEHKLGVTFFSWIVAPIPRSVWVNKPQISLGKEIKEKVLQKPAIKAGRPAGIVQEGYINLSWVGFFLVAFLFGYFMRLMSQSFLPVLKTNIFAASIYFPIYLNVASWANGSLSQGMVRTLSDVIPIYLIFGTMILLTYRKGGARYRSLAQPNTPAQTLAQTPAE